MGNAISREMPRSGNSHDQGFIMYWMGGSNGRVCGSFGSGKTEAFRCQFDGSAAGIADVPSLEGYRIQYLGL